MLNRRELIASIGTVGAMTIAGCSGSSSGPERAVKQYFTAYKENDAEKANEVLHPETSGYPVKKEGLKRGRDMTLISAEEISSAELADSDYQTYGSTESQLESSKQNIKSETGSDEVAWVLIEVEQNGETNEYPIATATDNGDWKVVI
jgi:hypothetical protein